MRIVKIWGGIGNQMFQYAFYKSLLEKDGDCKMDISYYEDNRLHNGYELNKVFEIQEFYANQKECQDLADHRADILSRIKIKTFLKKKSHYIENSKTGYSFKSSILEMKNIYFQGYFQSDKYFLPISEEIKKDFVFKNNLDPINKMVEKKMQEDNSVSIHVRRADYLNQANLAEVCTLKYYYNAIEEIETKIENPTYYIFSDDIKWCKENMIGDKYFFIENNKGDNSYKDMQLMSFCKHNIIANSSFSWWGAWLNNNPDKIVIAPEKWNNYDEISNQDIIPEGWLRIKVE